MDQHGNMLTKNDAVDDKIKTTFDKLHGTMKLGDNGKFGILPMSNLKRTHANGMHEYKFNEPSGAERYVRVDHTKRKNQFGFIKRNYTITTNHPQLTHRWVQTYDGPSRASTHNPTANGSEREVTLVHRRMTPEFRHTTSKLGDAVSMINKISNRMAFHDNPVFDGRNTKE